MTRRILLALVGIVALAGAAAAHQFQMSEIWVMFTKDGAWRADVLLDVDMLLQIPYEALVIPTMTAAEAKDKRLPSEQELRDFLREQFVANFDGKPAKFDVEFVSLTKNDIGYWTQTTIPPRSFRLVGRVPGGATKFSLKASAHFGVVSLSLRREGAGMATQKSVFPGTASPDWNFTGS
ncbi:MAG: hypothetical protein KJ042_07970 [Deltaproteobacteria bacterium]|nr:hypothetical protein [Deltaproteobacteria bacterium]